MLRPALLASAFLTIAVGAILFFAVDETVGIIVGAIGIVDLLMMPFILRTMQGARSENPYARED